MNEEDVFPPIVRNKKTPVLCNGYQKAPKVLIQSPSPVILVKIQRFLNNHPHLQLPNRAKLNTAQGYLFISAFVVLFIHYFSDIVVAKSNAEAPHPSRRERAVGGWESVIFTVVGVVCFWGWLNVNYAGAETDLGKFKSSCVFMCI